MTPLTPQLIGQTEKALNALLQTVLADHDLVEREWLTLRLTLQFDGAGDLDGFLADRLHDPDARRHLVALRERGLVSGVALTPAGTDLVAEIGATIATLTGPVWDDIPAPDAEAAARALNTILERTRALLREKAGDATG